MVFWRRKNIFGVVLRFCLRCRKLLAIINTKPYATMRTFEATPGQHIDDYAAALVEFANATGEKVGGDFNGISVTANPGDTAGSITDAWWTESQRRTEEYRKSPAGIEFAKRAAELRKKAEESRAEGILPFIKSDPDAWDECVRANDDPYGAAAVRFAARWANIMERRIDDGEALEEIADAASSEADAEGIAGFMYGCAVGILSRVWKHGEQLRRWHNLETQIGTEGEQANDAGTVLNPALLNIEQAQ